MYPLHFFCTLQNYRLPTDFQVVTFSTAGRISVPTLFDGYRPIFLITFSNPGSERSITGVSTQ
jgi:hypothetical protein